MVVALTDKKIRKTIEAYKRLQITTKPQISGVMGLIVSNFPGVQFGSLHYSSLERDKIGALLRNRGHYKC